MLFREMDPIDLIDDEIVEWYLSYTQQLVLHMNVDGRILRARPFTGERW